MHPAGQYKQSEMLLAPAMNTAPRLPLAFAPAGLDIERRADGVLVLRSPYPLREYPRCLSEHLERWARQAPDRTFIAQREGQGGWRHLTYGQALAGARALGAALISRGLSAQRPVLILSENSINHALLVLGAMHVGVPVAPVSVAYSLMSKDFAKLKSIAALLAPALVYAEDAARFEGALRNVDWQGAELVTSGETLPGLQLTRFERLLECTPSAEAERARASVTPDTIAKILLTSGSTGDPKGVINTQRMLCSNQESFAQLWTFLEQEPPVLCEWLPWNHTFGSNATFNMMLRNGGTMYIDEGKPAPGLIEKTVANLREISPTAYLNVPRGYDMLIPYLERDAQLRESFFRNLKMIFYAAAALPPNLWQRLEALSVQQLGQRVCMISAWGATETAPGATLVHYPIEQAGVVGLPMPGCEIKMVPNAGKYELRVRGENVTPGYWKRDDLTQRAFDEEGFYKTGDAGRFLDENDPVKGLVFDGRVAEDFKLSSGTWVRVGELRIKAIGALEPVAQDIVVTGHDRDEVGLLIFASLGCRALAGLPADAQLAQALSQPAVCDRVRAGLRKLAESGGSSTYATRALLLEEPPSIDAGEITDKGYINQNAVLKRRAELVEKLYADPPAPEVIVFAR